MINLKATSWFSPESVMARVNQGLVGNPIGGSAIVGPTKEAWYGQVHEYGIGHHPPRPFMYPALLNSKGQFPAMFIGLLTASRPALLRAAMIVEREAKILLSVGGGISHEPSVKGSPPHRQTGNLQNSISSEIL